VVQCGYLKGEFRATRKTRGDGKLWTEMDVSLLLIRNPCSGPSIWYRHIERTNEERWPNKLLVATGERKERGLLESGNSILNQLWKGGLSCGEWEAELQREVHTAIHGDKTAQNINEKIRV
jgi:hypothetical protein